MSIAAGLWRNRRDVRRWVDFVRRSAQNTGKRPLSDILTEAKVRAAVSSDPVLRHDASFDDLTVEYGVVTVLTTTEPWPDLRTQMMRLKRVKGITDVTTQSVGPVLVDLESAN
jgi:DNA primase